MPNRTHTQNYIAQIQVDPYWTERVIDKPSHDKIEFIKMSNQLENASYLATQAISDLAKANY